MYKYKLLLLLSGKIIRGIAGSCIFLCLLFIGSNLLSADYKIFRQTEIEIILPEKPTITEQFAAVELQKYMLEMMNLKLSIKNEGNDQTTTQRQIYLGAHSKNKELKKCVAGKDLEAFILDSDGLNLHILGNCDRATLYGVYTFLEQLGCRWVAPGIDYIPTQDSVTIKISKQIQSPGIKYRSLRYLNIEHYKCKSKQWFINCTDWAVKNRINVFTDKKIKNAFPVEIMKRGSCRGINNTHISERIFTLDLFKNSPEIFARDKNGKTLFETRKKRRGFGQQFCFSEPESVAVFADKLIGYIKQHPEVELFPITQADGIKYCQCPKCRKMYTQFGKNAVAKAWFSFAGKVADKINRIYPGKKFYTLAYNHTKIQPGEKLEINKNMIVVITHNEDWFHQFTKAKKGDFIDLCKKWGAISASGFGVYDYYPFSRFKFLPYVAMEKVSMDIKAVYDINCRYFEIQSDPRTVGTYLPIYYIAARAMWAPNMDVNKDVELFCQGMYGKAAADMKNFFNVVERAMAVYPEPYSGDVIAYLTKNVCLKAEHHLARAVSKADTPLAQDCVQAIADHFNFGKYLRLGRDAYASYNASNNLNFAKEANQYGNKIKELVNEVRKEKGLRFDLSNFSYGVTSRSKSGVGVEIGSWKSAVDSQKQMLPVKPGIRVGILTDTFGASTLYSALAKIKGIKVMKLPNINDNFLNNYQIVVINNTNNRGKWFSTHKEIVRHWVEQGGGIILLHDAVGYRHHQTFFPVIGSGVKNPRIKFFKKAAAHDINKELDHELLYEHGYYDHVSIAPGKNGKVFIEDENHNPVVVAGKYGQGGVVLNGMLSGYGTNDDLSYYSKEPVEGELSVLVNSIKWLDKIRVKPQSRPKEIGVIDPMDGKKVYKSYYRNQAASMQAFYHNNGHKAELVPVGVLGKDTPTEINEFRIIILPAGAYKLTQKMKENLTKYAFNGGLVISSHILRGCKALGIEAKGNIEIEKLFVEIECPLTVNLPLKKWISRGKLKTSQTANINAIELIKSDVISKPEINQPYLTYKLCGKGAFIYLNCIKIDNDLDTVILKNCVSQATYDWLVLK